MRIPRKLKKQMPSGPYCYSGLRWVGNTYYVKTCPMYGAATNGESYCKLFNKATDPVEWDCLLSDQCKVCGIKDSNR